MKTGSKMGRDTVPRTLFSHHVPKQEKGTVVPQGTAVGLGTEAQIVSHEVPAPPATKSVALPLAKLAFIRIFTWGTSRKSSALSGGLQT